jgi:hypothetical protein
MRPVLRILPLLLLATSVAAVDFDREIQPLLADRCFKCHGPDAKQRKAGLRLDQPDSLLEIRTDGGALIAPGQADQSELIKRIRNVDTEDLMPPPNSGLSLTAPERELFRQWIQEGAKAGRHWSFVAPRKRPLPVNQASAVDHFIREALAKSGLEPSPPTDPANLLRRVSLALTGLPPTPAEIDAFVADPRPDLFERIVDRLLASERAGEHMAVPWLDAARYADTSGLQYDIPRSNWPYRDWVIKAFNANLPYDRFLTWQLAGDLLPSPTLEQMIATGFNRLHPITSEGGTIDEEYRVNYVADRVATMGTVFMGLTLECARCHDHKYDPVTQREFYSLFAFFNQMEELGEALGESNHTPPGVPVPSPEQIAGIQRIKAEHARLNQDLAVPDPSLVSQRRAWEQGYKSIWTVLRPVHLQSYSRSPMNVESDLSIIVGGPNPPREIYGVVIPPGDGVTVTALRVEALRDPRLPSGGPGRAPNGNALLTDIGLKKVSPEGDRELLEIGGIKSDYEQPGFPVENAIDEEAPSGWGIGGPEPDDRAAVLSLKKPERFEEGEAFELLLRFASPYEGHAFGRFRVSFTTVEDPLDRDPTGRVEAYVRRPESARTESMSAEIDHRFRIAAVPRFQKLHRKLKSLEKEAETLAHAIPVAMVMQDNHPRATRVLERGSYDRPLEEVPPGTPAALPPLPPGAPRNRLTLANWLTSPGHPLTTRVAVNRLWQQIFGEGLVRTPNDFGMQGERPTHPELLDWLAVDFRENGWDMKRLLKQLVLSDTFRQSSRANPDLGRLDPLNLLLGRAPTRRLGAETIRDQALAVAGLLHEKIGGPGVRPYQPPGLWEQLTNREEYRQVYHASIGDDLYRRSVYTYWKRTAHHPAMAAFDAPSREACTVRREITNTPQQALALLHDPQFIEAARALARRMLTEPEFGESTASRIAHAFRLATGRPPSDRETTLLVELSNAERPRFAAAPAEANALIHVGDSTPPAGLEPADLATATMVARTLLNLAETITIH